MNYINMWIIHFDESMHNLVREGRTKDVREIGKTSSVIEMIHI